MNKKILKRISCLVLALVLSLGVMSGITFAQEGNPNSLTNKINVTVSACLNSTILEIPDDDDEEDVYARTVEVSADTAENYGYTDSVSNDVSALDVLVKVHELIYKQKFTENCKKYLDFDLNEDGRISKIFSKQSSDFRYAVDFKIYNSDNVFYNQNTLDSVISDGQAVDFYSTQYSPEDDEDCLFPEYYTWFEHDGAKINNLTVESRQKFDLTLCGIHIDYSKNTYDPDLNPRVVLAETFLTDTSMYNENYDNGVSDNDGVYHDLHIDKQGTFLLSAFNEDFDIYAPCLTVNVTARQSNTPPAPYTTMSSAVYCDEDEAYTVDLSKVFYDLDEDELTYKVSINSSLYTECDRVYTYPDTITSDVKLSFIASDGTDSSVPYNVTVRKSDDMHVVNLYSVIGSGTYKSENSKKANLGNVPFLVNSDGERVDFKTVRSNPTKPYSVAVPSGEYTYALQDEDYNISAKGNADVNGDERNIYLREINFRFNFANLNKDDQTYDTSATVSLISPSGAAIDGISNMTSFGYTWSFVTECLGEENEYCYTIHMNSPELLVDKTEGRMSYKQKAWTSRDNVDITPYSCNTTVEFKVTHGAGLRLFHKNTFHYMPFYEYKPLSIEIGAEYDSYVFNVPLSEHNFHAVAGGNGTGWLKTVHLFDTLSAYDDYPEEHDMMFTFDLERLDNNQRRGCAYATVNSGEPLYETVESDMFLNVDDSNMVNLKQDETFDLRAYRVNQAQHGDTANYFIEPDFHYEILSGADVVSVETGDTSAPGDEYVTIKAKKQGVCVMRIRYDALMINASASGDAYYNATDPINERIVIFNVSDTGAADVTTDIKQSEYDTIYYTEKTNAANGTVIEGTDHAEYSFTATGDELTVDYHEPVNDGVWTDSFTPVVPDENGLYNVGLKSGENIIRFTTSDGVSYYVISAKGITINIKNVTNEGKDIKVGDTVTVSFDTINLPNKKMAGLYNPGYPDTTWTHYNCTEADAVSQEEYFAEINADRASVGGNDWFQPTILENKPGFVRHIGLQYIIASPKCNGITFKVLSEGNIHLTGGAIHSEHYGYPLDAHRYMVGTGTIPNLNASNNNKDAEFSSLPDVSIYVKSQSDNPSENPSEKPSENPSEKPSEDPSENTDAKPSTDNSDIDETKDKEDTVNKTDDGYIADKGTDVGGVISSGKDTGLNSSINKEKTDITESQKTEDIENVTLDNNSEQKTDDRQSLSASNNSDSGDKSGNSSSEALTTGTDSEKKNSYIWIWISVLGVCVVAVVIIAVIKNKRKNK